MRTKTTVAIIVVALFFSCKLFAQTFTTPPTTPVRTMAEWEELQALVIAWNSYTNILTEIVRAARQECNVIVCCYNQAVVTQAKNKLTSSGVDISSNVTFVIVPTETIWVRDYGPNCVYANDVDSLQIVDWIYNRDRPLDNTLPEKIGQYLHLPVYSTSVAPYDLVNTGGNFMTDGMGTAFASKLVFANNDQIIDGDCITPADVFGTSNHTESEIDNIMQKFMGVNHYIKLDTLLYDCIHHLDMHIKMLNEETLLVGQYPEGIADGPQIEANLQFILDNVKTGFGTRFKVIRILMPPQNGQYPDSGGYYRTYTNGVFVNKTVIVPFYETEFDTMAQRIWQEALPGYKVVGVDCNAMISKNGAIHCITKEIGVNDPLRIVHKPIEGVLQNAWGPSNYPVTALIQHRSGIAAASVFYRSKNISNWIGIAMSPNTNPDSLNFWTAYIPKQEGYFDTLFYAIVATSNSGKTVQRPLPGPAGAWRFLIQATISSFKTPTVEMLEIYPNPASAITVIPVQSHSKTQGSILIFNSLGQMVREVFVGEIPSGSTHYFLDAGKLASGTYFVKLQTGGQVRMKKLVVR